MHGLRLLVVLLMALIRGSSTTDNGVNYIVGVSVENSENDDLVLHVDGGSCLNNQDQVLDPSDFVDAFYKALRSEWSHDSHEIVEGTPPPILNTNPRTSEPVEPDNTADTAAEVIKGNEFLYHNKEFWTLWVSDGVGYETATEMCRREGGEPAMVTSNEHYNNILEQIRKEAQADDRLSVPAQFWLGMTYARGVVEADKEAPYYKWATGGFGNESATCNDKPKQVYLRVQRGTNNQEGMKCAGKEDEMNGVLCQMKQ